MTEPIDFTHYEDAPNRAYNGGIQMALNWNGNRYADVHIIDLGTY